MRDHAHELLTLMHGRSRGDLDADRVLALAVVRLLEIIGEAAARVLSRSENGATKSHGRPLSDFETG